MVVLSNAEVSHYFLQAVKWLFYLMPESVIIFRKQLNGCFIKCRSQPLFFASS